MSDTVNKTTTESSSSSDAGQKVSESSSHQRVEEINKEKKSTNKHKRPSSSNQIPKNKVALKLIITSGKSYEFIFPLLTSVGDVTQFVYDNWPEEWAEEKESITSHHVLRLIYQGRFLHENVTFLALNLAAGKRTVMHLVPREKLPQLSAEDMEKSPKSTDRSCCCIIV